MRLRVASIAGAALILALACAGDAGAATTTLGTTTPPTPFALLPCDGTVYEQDTSDATTPYTVPGGGQITQWQTSTAGDPAGAAGTSVTFAVVTAPGSGGTVVGADTETLPNPLPAGGVARFTLSAPLTVSAGDTLAIYSSSLLHGCFFAGGTTPTGDTLQALTDASPPPIAGQQLTVAAPQSPSGYALNLAATFTPTVAPVSEDAAVSTALSVNSMVVDHAALLSWTVTNDGPGTGPITFTDDLPAGLSIIATAAGLGTCSETGQVVTCTISSLASGQSVPVNVVVRAAAAGNQNNSVSVAVGAGVTDPVSSNNMASATIDVVPQKTPSVRRCTVPRLANTPSQEAGTVLRDLGCKVRITHRRSKTIARGRTIRTNPKHGKYAFHKVVTVVVSSGPERRTR